MKILEINTVCGIRSTGRIAAEIAEEYINSGNECMIAYGREIVPEKCEGYAVRIGNSADIYMHFIKSALFDLHGFGSRSATKKFLKWAEEYDPDLLWLHNIHGYYINIELLFDWIKSRPGMQVIWTLHDCWAFTGHCSHFSYIGCDKWKTGCKNCPQKNEYPKSFFADNSAANFERKKKAFNGVGNMTLITPSEWLANLVRQSFLGGYPINVEYNKVNKEIFRPAESDFRDKYNLQNKKIILGVASAWSKRKGISDFIRLSEMLDEEYKIVLVGLTKEQIKNMPSGILCIERTNSIEELAKIYTAADLFVNPSREETFGLTTLEAIYCGTQAVVYENTACEEIAKKYGGIVLPANYSEIYKFIKRTLG